MRQSIKVANIPLIHTFYNIINCFMWLFRELLATSSLYPLFSFCIFSSLSLVPSSFLPPVKHFVF